MKVGAACFKFLLIQSSFLVHCKVLLLTVKMNLSTQFNCFNLYCFFSPWPETCSLGDLIFSQVEDNIKHQKSYALHIIMEMKIKTTNQLC